MGSSPTIPTDMAELVDALDLGSSETGTENASFNCTGSNPVETTILGFVAQFGRALHS